MPKLRRKPVVIEAEQFRPEKKPWPKGVVERLTRFDGETYHGGYHIQTRYRGWSSVAPGDWIVKSKDGMRYPCKPEFIEEYYDLVVDDPPTS